MKNMLTRIDQHIVTYRVRKEYDKISVRQRNKKKFIAKKIVFLQR